jgi:hypothetical protein
MFFSVPLQRQYGRRWYDFIVFRLVSYHTDAEVTQKGTKSLPEDGIVLLKHVGAIVKEK